VANTVSTSNATSPEEVKMATLFTRTGKVAPGRIENAVSFALKKN